MYFVTIGSDAALFYFNDFRKCGKDKDIICHEENRNREIFSYDFIEFHDPKEILGFQWILDNCDICWAFPEILYTLKFSHAIYDIHWNKTIHDIIFFQNKNIKLIPELLEILRKDWEIKHGKKKVSLAMTSKEFFNKHVYRRYDHDYLHERVKYEDKPIYKKILLDNHEVMIDREKFNSLSFEQQINLFREEMYVQALERYILIDNPTDNAITAYKKALKDVVTRLTKGWASDFILENISHYMKLDKNYTLLLK